MLDPDELLVRRAQRGDVGAFETLVRRHRARLYTLAARTLGSPGEAEDAVQEALVRAWRSLPRFRHGSRFSTWLYRITVNCAHDVRERRRAEPMELAEERADPRDALAAAELSGALQAALDSLDEPYREAIVLYDLLGCSYLEIADIVGVPEGTVKSRIFRGRRDLAAALGTSSSEEASNQ